MDRFETMRVFIRIVERRSFTRAAEDVGLPRSTVTEAVKQLETRLRVRLLQRTTRHVSPTLEGEAYYRRCLDLLADLEDVESAFGDAKPRGLLRVDVHGTLARHFVMPGLPRFLAEYPDLRLHLSEGDRLVDLVREGVDCVLRVGDPRDSDMIGRHVAMLEEVTCASPDYLSRFGTPGSPDDVAGHRMVGFVSSRTGRVIPLEFTLGDSVRHVTLPTTITVAGAETLVAAAKLGFGLIQAPRYHVRPALESGGLVAILEDCPPAPSPVFLLYPRSRQLSPRVRVFADWLRQAFRVRLAADAGGSEPPDTI